MAERRFVVAAGIAIVAGGAFYAVWRGLTPTPAADAPAPDRPAPPAPPVASPPPEEPADVRPVRQLPGPPDAPLGEEPVDDSRVRASWDERLALEDEALVKQAIAAGCDAKRADDMRRVLATKRQERASTLEALGAGRITREEMIARAQETKRKADAALRELLTPQELQALDPEGARAAAVEEEER